MEHETGLGTPGYGPEPEEARHAVAGARPQDPSVPIEVDVTPFRMAQLGLAESVDSLDEAIGVLSVRLAPVLRPPYPEPDEKVADEYVGDSEFTRFSQDTALKVAGLRARVMNLVQRLEV